MNIALIFAGGTGQRMNSRTTPKQFLELHGKPIIIYTLERFNDHPMIDAIAVVCLASWIPHLEKLLRHYGIDKASVVVPGGETGMDSIFCGLEAIRSACPSDAVVLVHDGVRPLIDEDTITRAIECTEKNGSAITVVPSTETVVQMEEGGEVGRIMDRKQCFLARAPQCFRLGELYDAHRKAQAENRRDFIDSAQLMRWYGVRLYPVEGRAENIKITTPEDFYIFRALADARENQQIHGM